MTRIDTGSNTAVVATVTVAATATLIRASNATRRSLLIQNTSAQDVYIGYTSAVTTSTGIKVSAGQAWYEDRYFGSVYGIVSTATSTVICAEVG